MSDFWEQYKRPEWQRKRLEVMEAADFKCENCDSSDKTLNVHHKLYVKGRKVWEYSGDELECLCESCHECVHELRDEMKTLVATLPTYLIDQLIGYARVIDAENADGSDDRTPVMVETYEQAVGVSHAIGFRDRCTAPSKIIDGVINEGGSSLPLGWLYEMVIEEEDRLVRGAR